MASERVRKMQGMQGWKQRCMSGRLCSTSRAGYAGVELRCGCDCSARFRRGVLARSSRGGGRGGGRGEASASGVGSTKSEQIYRLVSFRPEQVTVEKRIGEGSYGTVYTAILKAGKSSGTRSQHIILKKERKDVEDAEALFPLEAAINARCMLDVGTDFLPSYLGVLHVERSEAHGQLRQGRYLCWKHEGVKTLSSFLDGHSTLEDSMSSAMRLLIGGEGRTKGFPPPSLCSLLFDEEDIKKGVWLERAAVQEIVKQILNALSKLHAAGFVHRDIKPSNVLWSDKNNHFKLIDLGATADLQYGTNFNPRETFLDPCFCPPGNSNSILLF